MLFSRKRWDELFERLKRIEDKLDLDALDKQVYHERRKRFAFLDRLNKNLEMQAREEGASTGAAGGI